MDQFNEYCGKMMLKIVELTLYVRYNIQETCEYQLFELVAYSINGAGSYEINN